MKKPKIKFKKFNERGVQGVKRYWFYLHKIMCGFSLTILVSSQSWAGDYISALESKASVCDYASMAINENVEKQVKSGVLKEYVDISIPSGRYFEKVNWNSGIYDLISQDGRTTKVDFDTASFDVNNDGVEEFLVRLRSTTRWGDRDNIYFFEKFSDHHFNGHAFSADLINEAASIDWSETNLMVENYGPVAASKIEPISFRGTNYLSLNGGGERIFLMKTHPFLVLGKKNILNHVDLLCHLEFK